MRTSAFRTIPLNDEEMVRVIMKAKSEIDVIREERSLEDGHDLSLASDYLESFLDAIEKQKESN